jgi:hypothetical protein
MPVFRTLLVLALVAGASANVPRPARPRPVVPDSTWLDWNPTTRTMKFKLVAGLTGRGAKSPFNFNGYTDGEFTLVAPMGATVVFNFVNEDGTPPQCRGDPRQRADAEHVRPVGHSAGLFHQGTGRAGVLRHRRDPVQGGPGGRLPDLLRGAGAWIVGDVDPVFR